MIVYNFSMQGENKAELLVICGQLSVCQSAIYKQMFENKNRQMKKLFTQEA